MNTQLLSFPSELRGYWRLNGSGTETTTSDLSDYGNDGQLSPSPYSSGPQWGTGPDITLPVELSSFTASINAYNFVNLLWITQSETNVQGYYIYRNSSDNLAEAELVSPLIAATNTSQMQTYSYNDNEIFTAGTYYYWLQNMDFDGAFSFHGPISIDVALTGQNNLAPQIPRSTLLTNIYPNPFGEAAFIDYEVSKTASIGFDIYNTRGQLVRSFSEGSKNPNSYTLRWDGKDMDGNALPAGIYIVRMNSGSESSHRKIILVK